MADYMGSVFKLISSCNIEVNNTNDYNIARVILNHVDHLDAISLEELSHQSNISQASVSRFIKKMGFKSYQDFRESFQKAILEIKLNRKLANVTQYPHRIKDKMVDQIYEEALENLVHTKENINIPQLQQALKLMKHASSVTFYGDDHTLSIFYTLQLDLLANGVPAYLFKIKETQQLHMQFINKDSVILFFNIYEGFFNAEQASLLKIAKNNGATIILFTQDELSNHDLFDLEIYYGQAKSFNTGYYSLLYMSRILSELYYDE